MSLYIRTGMRRWKWAPRWCHLDFCNWTWHFADGALAHCFGYPPVNESKSPWKTHKIPVVLKYHQKFAGFFRGHLSFRGKYMSNFFCDVSTLCRLLRYRIILILIWYNLSLVSQLRSSRDIAWRCKNTIPRVKFQSKSSTFGNYHDSVEVSST